MPKWAHRTTFQVLTSVASADLPEPIANYVEEPDLSAVISEPMKYWSLSGDAFSLVDQATRDSIDLDLLSASRDALANDIDRLESYSRAFALTVLDEINILRAEHGLSARTASQLKTALRNKLNG